MHGTFVPAAVILLQPKQEESERKQQKKEGGVVTGEEGNAVSLRTTVCSVTLKWEVTKGI